MMTPEQHEAEAKKARDRASLYRSKWHSDDKWRHAVAEARSLAYAHDELAAVKRLVNKYRGIALAFGTRELSYATSPVKGPGGYSMLDFMETAEASEYANNALSLLRAEGLVENHPTIDGVFRILPDAKGIDL